MEYKSRRFSYKCKCGFTLIVHIDFGTPQEKIKCKKCEAILERNAL